MLSEEDQLPDNMTFSSRAGKDSSICYLQIDICRYLDSCFRIPQISISDQVNFERNHWFASLL